MILGILTLMLLVMFVLGTVWLWLPAQRAGMEQAALLPLQDDEAGEAHHVE